LFVVLVFGAYQSTASWGDVFAFLGVGYVGWVMLTLGIPRPPFLIGFVLAGTGTKQLLIRAVGPGLAVFGVTGVLADPLLQVVNSAGTTVAANDNWDFTLASTFAQVAAFPLTPNSRDAALLVTLPAGASYTVQVSGVNNGTGEALIEVYEIF